MNSDRSKYLLWAGFVAVVLIITFKLPSDHKIYRADDNGNRAVDTETPVTNEQQKFSFSLNLPSFFSDDVNRISNENCGISFKIPETWTVSSMQEGERFCMYYIKNPDRRGATLEIGVPGASTMSQNVEWNEFVQYMQSRFNLKSVSIPHATEAYQTERTVFPPSNSDGLTAISDPMYIFRKDQAVYYIRYGYVDYDGRNMLDDISSVVSSIKFQKDRTFYESPLRSRP